MLRLSGVSPFQANSYNEIVMKNYHCEIDFETNGLRKKCSAEALSLLQDLLDYNPRNRPTASQALKYRWFDQHVHPTKPVLHL